MATCYLTFTQVTRALSSVTPHPTGAVAEAITLSVSNQEIDLRWRTSRGG